ncbi:MAG: glutathione S-transferase family protein [Pseudomonadota bacterium]
MSSIKVSAFCWVPPFAQGQVRDLRVRWALEEVGLSYDQRLLTPATQHSEEYRSLQPFNQVPSYEEDGMAMFESGAIVLHVAEKSETLCPADETGKARMTSWIFAALNSVEPALQNLAAIDLFYADQEWAKLRRPGAEQAVLSRLKQLTERLENRHYLEDRFTAGDLMMAAVLQILRHTDLVARFPVLQAYNERCTSRPAYRKAHADQMAVFAQNPQPAK